MQLSFPPLAAAFPPAPCWCCEQIALMLEMLHLEPFVFYPLTLHFLSSAFSALRGGLRPPPLHVAVEVAPLEALPPEIGQQGSSQDADPSEGSIMPAGADLL